MRSFKTTIQVLGFLFSIISMEKVSAQFMPVVYDNVYGKEYRFTTATADFQSGDVVTANQARGRIVLTWLNSRGESRFSKRFNADEISLINKLIPLSEDKILIVGQRKLSNRENNHQTGRAMIINIKGGIERNINVGQNGTTILNGEVISNGHLILSGSTPNSKGGNSAFICKLTPQNKVVYDYIAAVGESCQWFNVLGSRTEYLNAAFSSVDKVGSSVVRLDENGKPYFITKLPDPTFKIEKMISSVDGEIYIVGQGEQTGGAVIKIRQEGDIVFQKQIVPATSATKLDKLIVCPTGEILVGGNDLQNAYFALLRSDGTELSSNVDMGFVAGIANNPVSGDCIVSLYSPLLQGKIIKLSKQGRRLYEKFAAANYSSLRVDKSGDLLMASPQSGRLTMLSNLGELLFDRYVVENTPQQFADVYLPTNGEVVFADSDSRVAKLAHGVYVGDILVNKPINGYTTATFTVILSGFSYSQEGAPIPVTVNYKTQPVSAGEGVNYDPVDGTISFIPSTDGSNRYLNKYIVEVPVKANDLLEGDRTFSLDLRDINNSYLIRSQGTATIEDQPAMVRMIATTPGTEGEADITYTLGIFKTNGVALTNATKADIVVDGIYGNGTADKLDFDMGRLPRLVIAPGQNSGQFNVVTAEDTRYESVKTVVVNFNKIYAMSDTNVSFGAHQLACTGQLYDQAATASIQSLGDHTKLNNAITGFFKVSLLRAKDGALLTNNSGGDIFLTVEVNDNSTAKQGSDFVLSNAHDLRIWGDDRSSAVNLNGVVLYSPGTESKTVSVSLKGARARENSGKLSVSSDKNTAQFTVISK